MSDVYVRRLARVQEELDALRDAVQFASRNAGSPGGLRRADENLEAIFVIRLFAVFEGVLKEHLAQHHPNIVVPEDARAVWLIDRVAQRQTPPITFPLRNRVHEVRRWRNFLIHPGGGPALEIFWTDALARLSRFADHLPEPR